MMLLSMGCNNNRQRRAIYFIAFVVLSFIEGGHSFSAPTAVKNTRPSQRLHSNFNSDDGRSNQNENSDSAKIIGDDNDETSTVPPSVVTIDGGGFDLTDRFKYKVHALMGTTMHHWVWLMMKIKWEIYLIKCYNFQRSIHLA